MNTQDTLKLARKAFDALQPLNDIDWTHHRDALYNLCKAEEKGHRGWGPDFAQHHTSDTASVSDAAKLFAVKRIAEYMNGEKPPSGKDFLHIQKSCFYAAGLVDEYREKLASYWSGFDIATLAQLDYCALVKVKGGERDLNDGELSPEHKQAFEKVAMAHALQG